MNTKKFQKRRLQTLAGILNESYSLVNTSITPTPSVFMSPAPESHGADVEIGHQDDELGMIKSDVGVMCDDLTELYDLLCDLHKHGKEIDFPHWWQSKIVLAKEYISAATDYLKQEVDEDKY